METLGFSVSAASPDPVKHARVTVYPNVSVRVPQRTARDGQRDRERERERSPEAGTTYYHFKLSQLFWGQLCLILLNQFLYA